MISNLTVVKIQDMEHDMQWELGSEESEEPLRGEHVNLQTHVRKMSIQVD